MANGRDEMYPNAPLYGVDFEMRFNGETAIDARKNQYQKLIKERYPNLLIPNSVPGQAYDLIPYSFRSKDDNKGVFLSIAQFGIFTKTYQNFDEYFEFCTREIDIFLEVFPEIDVINRYGLRYNNFILFDRDETKEIPLFKLLGFSFKNEVIPNMVTDFDFKYNFMVGHDTLSLMCKPVVLSGQQEAISFALDYSSEKDLNKNGVGGFLKRAHLEIKKVFEGLVTDKFREQMKGNFDG